MRGARQLWKQLTPRFTENGSSGFPLLSLAFFSRKQSSSRREGIGGGRRIFFRFQRGWPTMERTANGREETRTDLTRIHFWTRGPGFLSRIRVGKHKGEAACPSRAPALFPSAMISKSSVGHRRGLLHGDGFWCSSLSWRKLSSP